ncbi:hypothetical protein ACMFMG_004016 [Clarireedia jacksonii]
MTLTLAHISADNASPTNTNTVFKTTTTTTPPQLASAPTATPCPSHSAITGATHPALWIKSTVPAAAATYPADAVPTVTWIS